MRRGNVQSFKVVAGTTAELLKLWPILLEMGPRFDTELILTGQHYVSEELLQLVTSTGVKLTRKRKNRDISGSLLLTVAWLLSALPSTTTILLIRKWWGGEHFGVVVQGDTLTTLFGAVAARISGHRVFHIEAGYRTNNWKNPFPEELVRRLVGRIADVNYCPSENEARNIHRRSAQVIISGGNTGLDSLALALKESETRTEQVDDLAAWLSTYSANYGILTLHRFELFMNFGSNEQIRIVEELRLVKDSVGLLVLVGTFEKAKLTRVFEELTGNNVLLANKLEYLDFVRLLGDARFVITDSGGLAQECSALGTPCFIARDVVEEKDLRSNSILIGTGFKGLATLVNSANELRLSSLIPLSPSPTKIIVQDLVSYAKE